jgi:hypothetical protein
MPNPLSHLVRGCLLVALAGCVDDDAQRADAAADAALDLGTADAAFPCDGGAACADDDPCTVDRCVEGDCVWTRPDAGLEVVATIDGPVRAAHLRGDRLYVARGAAGFAAFDLSKLPDEDVEETFARVPADDEGPAVGLVADNDFVYVWEGGPRLRIHDRRTGEPVGGYTARDAVQDFLVFGRYAYAAVFAKGVEGVDLEDRAAPRRLGRGPTAGRALGLGRRGNQVIVADGLAGLARVNVSEREAPTAIETLLTTEGRAVAVSVAGDLAVLAELGGGLGVVDLAPRDGPERLATLLFDADVTGVTFLDRRTVAVAAGGLFVVDLLTPAAPTVWFAPDLGAPVQGVHAHERRAAVAQGDAGVTVVRLRCPEPAMDAGAE